MAKLKDLFLPSKDIRQVVETTETDLLIEKLRDVQRPELTATILTLEGQGAVCRVPPSNAVADRARVLAGDDTPAATKLNLALVQAYAEREAVESALAILFKRQTAERNARQRQRISERMPQYRTLLQKRVDALEALIAANRQVAKFQKELGSPTPQLPAGPQEFVLLGCNDGVLLRDDAAAFLKSANNYLKAN
jgi:hypothetical protein